MRLFAPFNISFLPFCDSNNTDSFLTIQFWTKNYEKARTELSKHREKRNDPKNWNGQILSPFDHTFSDWNNSKLCKFHRFATSHSFFSYFLLIFQICIVQWLNWTNLKYELNCSYNGGGVVYLRKSEASRSTLQYCKDEWDASLFHHT